ncbi:MAG: DMT family transporter [Rhodospirillales bacterium]
MNLREWTMLCALALMWGSAFMFTKLALTGAAPMEIALIRSAIGLALLLTVAFCLFRRGTQLSIPPKGITFWLGLTGAALPFILMSWGQQHINSALAGILVSAVPVFTVLIGHFIEGETKMTRRSVTGVLIGLAGVALIIGPGALGGLSDGLLGQLAIIMAALGYGCAALIGRRVSGHSPVLLGAGQMIVSLMVIAPAYLTVQGLALPEMTGTAWFFVFVLALVASALPPILMFRLLRTVTATQLSLVSYLVPVVALLWGVLLFGERLHAGQIAGFTLILASLWAINRRSA